MTLVLAIGYTDGLVIAADSASTDADSGLKQSINSKVKQLGNHPILYGGSGDVGLLQKVDSALSQFSPKDKVVKTRRELRRLVVPELMDAVRLHVPYPAQPYNDCPSATLLFVGFQDGKPWIVEIERNGGDTHYGAEFGNFAAIGSGKPLAQALFRPHLERDRDLELGKIFALRVAEDAIDLAMMGLARPVHVFTLDARGVITKLSDEELSKIRDSCDLWRALEREAVGRLLARDTPPDAPPDVPEIPLPPDRP